MSEQTTMQYSLDGVHSIDKMIELSIERLQEHQPTDRPYKLGFSGGKDSITCKHLCELADVKFEAHYSMTTIDPPEVTAYIREHHPDVIWDKPYYKQRERERERTNFYKLVELKGLPTRKVRWCCDYLKEVNGMKGDTMILGVRWEESANRAGRPIFSTYKGKSILNPIVDWTSANVWDFIKREQLPYPSLYDGGHRRLGCILCPLSCRKARIRDYEEYPNHVLAIEKALQKFLERKPDCNMHKWGKTPHDMVYYWVHESPLESAKGACLQNFMEDNK